MSFFVKAEDLFHVLTYNGVLILPFFICVFVGIVFYKTKIEKYNNIYSICFGSIGFLGIFLVMIGMLANSVLATGYFYKNNEIHIKSILKNEYVMPLQEIKNIEVVTSKPMIGGGYIRKQNEKELRTENLRLVELGIRLNGASTGAVSVGVFRLTTGEKVKAFLYRPYSKALLIQGEKDLFLIGSPNVMELYNLLQSSFYRSE